MVFSPDGRTLALGGASIAGTSVTVWDYTRLTELRADPAGYACAIVGRGLSADEWADSIPEYAYRPTCAR